MKTRILSAILAAALAVPVLTGCGGRMAQQVESAGKTAEQRVESVGETLKQAVTPSSTAAAALTPEDAQSVALRHAGLTTDQVTSLYTKYEVERGIPKYDVEFHHDGWEYDYDIHADTGEILSFSKDD